MILTAWFMAWSTIPIDPLYTGGFCFLRKRAQGKKKRNKEQHWTIWRASFCFSGRRRRREKSRLFLLLPHGRQGRLLDPLLNSFFGNGGMAQATVKIRRKREREREKHAYIKCPGVYLKGCIKSVCGGVDSCGPWIPQPEAQIGLYRPRVRVYTFFIDI